MSTYDAVVVGAGPNGLVAANRLVDAGWSVLVLEAQPDVGGAVRSDTEVHPGFVHDTFSAFYPLAAASRTIRSFALEEHGLVWRHAPAVLGHPLRDGSWALLHRDPGVTAALADERHRGDGDAWLELCAEWDVVGEALIDALLTPFPPVRPGLRVLARLRRAGGLSLVRKLLTPAADLGNGYFGGDAPRLLLAGNAGHSDIPLDAPGSGLMAILMSMLGQTVGFPAPEGGAGRLTEALASRLRTRGGEIQCDAEVSEIVASGLRSYPIHFALLDEAARLYQHSSTLLTAGGYFISFPCMHVVKPTLALWYLRAHKKIGWLLTAYLLVLPVAIVLLEMHYFVDIPVGFAIAAIVIVISDSAAWRSVQRLLQDCLHAGRSPKRAIHVSSSLS